jgi:hypothetical protein
MISEAKSPLSKAERSSRASGTTPCEKAEPEDQGTADQQCDGQLNRNFALVAWKEEYEETTEQHVKADTHEPTQPMLERALR